MSRTEYMRMWREKNKLKLREYKRKYNKQWRIENGYHNEQNSKKRYPEKQKARALLHLAIKRGIIKRRPCEICGKRKSQGHHENYFKPLEVNWLCPIHHTERHRK